MSAQVRENLQYTVVGRAGSACNSRDAQDILARASPSENYSALPVQCQDRFIWTLILYGKTGVNRASEGNKGFPNRVLLEKTRYNRIRGPNFSRVFSSKMAFFSKRKSSIFDRRFWTFWCHFLSVKPDVFVHSYAFYLDETRIQGDSGAIWGSNLGSLLAPVLRFAR